MILILHVLFTAPFNIFCRESAEFKQLLTTCNSLYRELREQGVGAEAKATEVFTDKEVEMLWSSDVLNPSTPPGPS